MQFFKELHKIYFSKLFTIANCTARISLLVHHFMNALSIAKEYIPRNRIAVGRH